MLPFEPRLPRSHLPGSMLAFPKLGPFRRDPNGSAMILFLNRVADIDEFPVFKDEKAVLLSQ